MLLLLEKFRLLCLLGRLVFIWVKCLQFYLTRIVVLIDCFFCEDHITAQSWWIILIIAKSWQLLKWHRLSHIVIIRAATKTITLISIIQIICHHCHYICSNCLVLFLVSSCLTNTPSNTCAVHTKEGHSRVSCSPWFVRVGFHFSIKF